MNVNNVLTKVYENETLGKHGKNKPNSNPISNPIKANQSQSKPIKPNFKANQNPKNTVQIVLPNAEQGILNNGFGRFSSAIKNREPNISFERM